MKAMGVSRTVVREAVAALRAEGLVTTRQGSGAFVAADASRVPFRIDPEGLSSIGDVLEVMELRLAIEVESAALAAARATPQTVAAIGSALRDMEAAISRGEGAVGFTQLAGGIGDGPRYVTGPVYVTGPDIYVLDGNHDGIGCQ